MSQSGPAQSITSSLSIVQTLTGNSGGAVGPDAFGNINVLGNNTSGINIIGMPGTNTLSVVATQATTTQQGAITLATQAQTQAFSNSSNAITPATLAPTVYTLFTVSPNGIYTTIQAAVTAAIAAGGAKTVLVRPGTYTENINFTGGGSLNIVGATGLGDEGQVEIIGHHTPPTSGTLIFRNFKLSDATHIFTSAAAGSTHLVIIDALLNVTNGYTFDLPNWTGIFELFDINGGSLIDGGVNNTGGASLFVFAAGLGSGTGQTMQLSGLTVCQGAGLDCPVNFSTGSIFQLDDCVMPNGITLSNNSTGTFFGCRIGSTTLATAAITMSSSANIGIWNGEIGSTFNPCIGGAGIGTLTMGTNTFLSNSAIAGTVVKGYTTPTEVGTLYAQNLSFDRGSTTLSSNGQLVIGKTGFNPVISTLTAGAGITITNGAGSITIAVSGGGVTWTDATNATYTLVAENGYVTDRGGGVTFTLPASGTLGDEITIVGKLGLTTIAQNANQQIVMSSSSSTVGVTGSVVGTNVGDCINLICITAGASTVWRANTFIGNWTVT